MIYGDNPNKINEREDALGLKAYTYAPNIFAIIQAGNLYVYCGNNAILYSDSTGRFFSCIVGALVGGISGAIFESMDAESTKDDVRAGFWGGLVSGFISGLAVDLLTYFGGPAIAILMIAGIVGTLVGEGVKSNILKEEYDSSNLIKDLALGGGFGAILGFMNPSFTGFLNTSASSRVAFEKFMNEGVSNFGTSFIEELISVADAKTLGFIYDILEGYANDFKEICT